MGNALCKADALESQLRNRAERHAFAIAMINNFVDVQETHQP